MQRGIGEGHTREDHSAVSNQLYAAYARGKEARELEIVLGEAALTDLDRLYVKFADRLESEFIAQGEDENRTMKKLWLLDGDFLGCFLEASLRGSEMNT